MKIIGDKFEVAEVYLPQIMMSDKVILQLVHELKPVGTIMKPFDDSQLHNMIEKALDFSDSCALPG